MTASAFTFAAGAATDLLFLFPKIRKNIIRKTIGIPLALSAKSRQLFLVFFKREGFVG
jgi:hypothetical protein